MTKELSERVKKACGDAVIADAIRWHQRGSRRFRRPDETRKSLGAKVSKHNDAIFAEQDEHSDDSMRTFYEQRAARYGVVDRLPWKVDEDAF